MIFNKKKQYFISYCLEDENKNNASLGNVFITIPRKIKTQQDIRYLEKIIADQYNKEHNDEYTTACILNFRVI